MVSVLQNGEGYIYAYADWKTTNHYGHHTNKGLYIYVQHLWIHKKYRGTDAIKKLITLIDEHPNAVNALWVYWQREKYNKRLSKSFPRWKAAKKGVKECSLVGYYP